MKWIEIILGLLCVLAGTIFSHVIYAKSDNGTLFNPTLFAIMLVAAGISFAVFAVCHLFLRTAGIYTHLILGAIASYAVMIALFLVSAGITGNLDEMMMWMPIILLSGVPYMAPLIGGAWLGSVLIFGNGKEQPEQPIPTDSEKLGGSPQG